MNPLSASACQAGKEGSVMKQSALQSAMSMVNAGKVSSGTVLSNYQSITWISMIYFSSLQDL